MPGKIRERPETESTERKHGENKDTSNRLHGEGSSGDRTSSSRRRRNSVTRDTKSLSGSGDRFGTTKAPSKRPYSNTRGLAVAAGFVAADVGGHVVLNATEAAAEAVGELMTSAPETSL